MRYLGGKSRYAKAIADVINPIRGSRTLWDPFCGGLASAAAFGGELVCSDVNAGLIALYRQLQADVNALDGVGECVTREIHAAAKRAPVDDPLAAFIKFTCSFGGDPAGGFALEGVNFPSGTARNYATTGVNSLKRKFRTLDRAWFEVVDFLAADVTPELVPGFAACAIYLDPPYPGTTGYGFEFDHELFRARARAWAAVTDVWVSGYEWPADAGELVWEAPAGGKRGLPTKGRERLWKVCP
jgi:site-specific DNA-adenine methylase